MKLVWWVLILAMLIQVVPFGHSHTNPAVRKEPGWDSSDTASLFHRACYDCHSNQTTWLWYSKRGARFLARSKRRQRRASPPELYPVGPVGGIGASNPAARGPVGNCAECTGANKLANQGSDVNNLRFTQAKRPRTGEVIEKCSNCKVMFPNQ
jgi:hypothetical protein